MTTSNDDYGIRWTGEGVAYPYPSSRTWSAAERELAEAWEEIGRLKDQRHELLEYIAFNHRAQLQIRAGHVLDLEQTVKQREEEIERLKDEVVELTRELGEERLLVKELLLDD